MNNYIPRGKALKALLFLDEEGAQYNGDLAIHIGCARGDTIRALESALRHKLISREQRFRSVSEQDWLWFLTPAGCELLDRMRLAEGGVA
jgi:DNA-binding MarR family transcriptional regulator